MKLRQICLLVMFHQLLCHGSWALRPPPSNSIPLENTDEDHSTASQPSATISPTFTPANKILSVETNCTRDLFEIRIDLGKKFRGILFAKDFVEECRTRGNQANHVTLRIPTSGCGVRSEMGADGGLELSVKVMLQMDGKLRQRSDIEKVVKCKLPANMMMVDVMDSGDAKKSTR